MKKFCLFLLAAAMLITPAAADRFTSYAEVQRILLAPAYKTGNQAVRLSGTVSEVLHSYTFKDMFYMFVLVDPDDVAMWSTEDDNFFVVQVTTDQDPFPFKLGETVTVEGKMTPLYSSPVCPYIIPETINGTTFS